MTSNAVRVRKKNTPASIDDDHTLSVLSQIEHKVATITVIEEAKGLADEASALLVYARRARNGLLVLNHCAFVKLSAERRGVSPRAS